MIVWSENGACRPSEGYGVASVNILNQLIAKGIDINRNIITGAPNLGEISKMIGYFDKTEVDSDFIINHSLPDAYKKAKHYSVGFTYWETNKLKKDWVVEMNKMDEVWTASRWAKQVFIDSGVKVPVYDFKLGIDPHHYYPKLRHRKNNFVFLSIGSPSTRKNSQIAVDAFIKLFGNKNGYSMIYKSNGPPDARVRLAHGDFYPLSQNPKINVIDWEVSELELAKIYDEVDCVIYPTSGEGWGILPMQGIAKGIPTICTNATACTEFAHLSVPLDFSWSTEKMSGIYSGAGEWAYPNFDDLCDKMLYVVNNYDEVAQHTYAGAEYIKNNLTWDKVTIPMADRICQITK